MNITIKQELEKFIQQQIKSGKYESADRVIEEALNLLEKREQDDRWVEEVSFTNYCIFKYPITVNFGNA
ncbi:MAG: type II toxin-antitoxin system ParD family antitoxin [Xenococcaceae cyanobacterium]